MKRSVLAISSLCLGFALAATLSATPAFAEDQLSGEILDLSCFISHDGKGPAHKGCAQSCAEHGAPLGLLTADSTVYVLYGKHGDADTFAKVKTLAGSNVKMTGTIQENAGLKGFEVHSVEAAE